MAIQTRTGSQNLHCYRGEGLELTFPHAGAGEDITAWGLAFTLKARGGTAALLTLTVGDGITVTDAEEGTFLVRVTGAQTEALTADQYRWDVWRTDGDYPAVLVYGTLTVGEPVRQP